MKKNEAVQIAFDRGIIEMIKQDTISEESGNNPSFSSCLWLQNYNPNLQTRSAILRPGEATITTWKGQPTAATLPALALADYIPNGIVGYTTFLRRYSLLQHARLYDTRKPYAQQAFVLFLRGLDDLAPEVCEETRIVSFLSNGDNNGCTWYEPFKDGYENPGWMVRGSFADITRHGESLLFTTALEIGAYTSSGISTDAAKAMYPCYVWNYWDISQKRTDSNLYYNGYTGFSDLISDNTGIYKHFKVRLPSMYFNRNAVVESCAAEVESDGTLSVTRLDANGNPTSGDLPPVQVFFWETPIRRCTRPVVHEAATGSPIYDYASDFFRHEGLSYVESLEALRHDPVYENCWPSDNKYRTVIENTGTPVATYRKGKGVFRRGGKAVQIEAISNTYGDEIKDNRVDKSTRVIWLHGVRLPNYLENGQPRPWLQGEKVPFVITIVKDGVEIVASKGTYAVRRKNAPVYPTLFDPTAKVTTTGDSWDECVSQDASDNPAANDARYECLDQAKARDLTTASGAIVAVPGAWYIVTPRDEYKAYCYEPWNASLYGCGAAYNATNAGHQYNNVSGTDRYCISIGADLSEYNEDTMLMIGLRIDTDEIKTLLDGNISGINVYIAKPDQSRGLLNSVGIIAVTDAPQGMYQKQAADPDDLTQYALAKSFVLDGITKGFADDFDEWESYRGSPLATNAWKVDGSYLYAVPQYMDGTPFTAVPNFYGYKFDTGSGNDPDELNGTAPAAYDEYWTPDFILWDYPVEKSLTLNSSGDYWQGRGARIIVNIKGRNFIGGCINEDGSENQAEWRYPDVQNGVISYDVFSKENALTIGHFPSTAGIEFREQLWTFSRRDIYRITFPDITNELTWEVLEKLEGQGTFSMKTVLSTVEGVIWANEAGIWISDGRTPVELSAPVQSIYQRIATDNPYKYIWIHDPGFPCINNEGFNPLMELHYDAASHELILTSPLWYDSENELYTADEDSNGIPDLEIAGSGGGITGHAHFEIRLIYSFVSQNWRVERYDLTTGDEPEIVTYSSSHRVHLCHPDMMTSRIIKYTDSDHEVQFGRQSVRQLHFDTYTGATAPSIPIDGRIITHEIGDGRNDFILNRAILEVEPDTELLAAGYSPGDTTFTINPRNKLYAFQNTNGQSIELIGANITAKGESNPFTGWMQTPTVVHGGSISSDDFAMQRESLALTVPFTRFRHARFDFRSRIVKIIRSITVAVAEFRRRNYG